MAAAESEALHTLAQPGLSRADLTRLLEALVVRGRFRSFTPFVDLGVVGFFAIFVRRRARATANVWTDQRLELALAAAAVGLVAVFGATSLRWSGGVRRLSMVSAALARLSPEAGPIASDTDAPWCLPADLSDPTLSIDRNASLRVVPRLGRPREAARHGMQNSASQLLVVESRDRWLGLLVAFRIGAPSFFPSETTDDDDTRVVPLERSSVGYHIAGDNATWRETALRAHVHEDSVIAFLPRNTLPADVAGVAKTLMNGDRVYPAFRRVVLSAPREATEAPLSAAVESYLSKRRADCVAAGRKAIEESAKTREAFEELLRKNPTLSSESLEFVVGALTLSAGSWRPNAVMRITDCATGTALGCDGSREQFAVDYEFGGTAVSKRSGSTRGTWHATPGHQPSIRFGSVQVSGHFAPESSEAGIPNPIDLVRKIVRPKFGEFRRCYKKGLEKNPDLQGQVTVRFTIAKDGSVTNVVHAGHEFADAEGARCIARVFPDLTFPRPAGGVVRVAMPVTLMAQ